MIYLDNAATTRTAPEVVEAMLPYFTEAYGNPGGIYGLGMKSKRGVNHARGQIANCIGAKGEEIYFTSGGSEADNWALKAVAESCAGKGKHIITCKIEHHAILHTCEYLEKKGYEVTYLDVDAFGQVDPEAVRNAIRPDTILISIMYANNEVGTIQPIEKIGEIAREQGVLFHTDAVQAFGQLPIDVNACHIDLLSASAHKLNGPKGMGCLYIRKGVKLPSFMHGGAQERGRRSGTENVPGIVGFGMAAECARRTLKEKIEYESHLREYLLERLMEIPSCSLNGHPVKRLPNNVNVFFEGIEGESLLIRLDMLGICASSGSACTSGSLEPSHVLTAMGLDDKEARSALRLTLSQENTIEEMDRVAEAVKGIVKDLRSLRGLEE